jgi:putative ABC transport system permease protein
MALGAQESTVLRLVVREALALATLGVAIGAISAYYLSAMLGTMLFEIPPGDPATLAAVSALLLLVALAASYVPARRATRVDPVMALRSE